MMCPTIQQITESSRILGKKWTFIVMEQIAQQKFEGFNKFISDNMVTPRSLSIRLKELEEIGLVEKIKRSDDGFIPTRYRLTTKGVEIHELFQKIKGWNMKWNEVRNCLNPECIVCGQPEQEGM